MFQNAFHIAPSNNCGINVKADVLYQEEIIQKIVVIQYTVGNNTALQMQWIFN
jgi:hypothetical protein